MSKFIKVAAGLALATVVSSAALAGTSKHYKCRVVSPPPPPKCVSCDGPKTGKSTLPPLSSYFDHQAKCVAKPPVKPAPPPIVIHPPKDDCVIIVHRPKRHCYVVERPPVVHPPVVHPPVVHPPIVRPPVIHPPVVRPPVVRPPVIIRPPVVYRPVVPVPYPVPYPVYTGCAYNPCPPVRTYSRYGN